MGKILMEDVTPLNKKGLLTLNNKMNRTFKLYGAIEALTLEW